MEVDIIIPVWNKPVETRNCLASLVERSPGCRLIMVDNGSDRDTRVILQETAEHLNERALLLCRQRNDGFIGSVNTGLDRSAAPWVAVVKSTSIVTEGWLVPVEEAALARPDAGILVPAVVPMEAGRRKGKTAAPPLETDGASFESFLMRRELFLKGGMLDADLGDSLWGRQDLSRRAYLHGFTTLHVPGSVVHFTSEPLFGSVARREARETKSRELFLSRWGERREYCIYFPKESDISAVTDAFHSILTGARQGDLFTVILHHRQFTGVVAAGFGRLHTSINLVGLSRVSLGNAALKAWRRLQAESPQTVPVAGVREVGFPEEPGAVPFAELAASFAARDEKIYGRKKDVE